MRLNGIHSLHVADLPVLEGLFSEAEGKMKPGGNRKNEGSPAAKAYRGSGKSQEIIAKKAGVHPSTISRYKSKEAGIERKPSFDTLKRLTAAVGSRASSIFPELGA